MSRIYSIILAVAAMVALASSLPLEWMTMHNGQLRVSTDDARSAPRSTPQAPVHVTGFNGHVTFCYQFLGFPIWLIVLAGLFGTVISLLNSLRVTSLQWLGLVPLGASAFYIAMALVVSVVSDKASLGIGNVVALVGSALALVHFTLYGQHSKA